MDAVRNGMELNGRVWKEPRGFIKILELIFGICAFATTSSFTSSVWIKYTCTNQGVPTKIVPKEYPFAYPFDLVDEKVLLDNCGGNKSIVLGGSHTSSAEFFVAVGVVTFLYCLGALLVYIFVDKLYRSRDSVAQADFITTVVLAFLWLVASSAWAHGVTGVKAATDPEQLANRLNHQESDSEPSCTSCLAGDAPKYSNLNISVLFGFLNFFIWSGNVWFLWKETAWYKNSHPDQTPAPMTGSLPGMAPAKL